MEISVMSKLNQHFPWTYDYCPYFITDGKGERQIPCFEIVDSEGRRVAVTDEDTPPKVQEVHARLLSTAPEMLDALVFAENWINDECERRSDEDNEYESPAHKAVDVIRAVIAKAKGGSK
jgi:hypothetical protein